MLHSFTSIIILLIILFSSEEVFLYNSLESLPHEQHSNPLILFSMCMLDIQDKKRRQFVTIVYIFITTCSIHCANNRCQPSDQKNEDFYKFKKTSLFIPTMLSICIQDVEKQRRGHFFYSYNLIYRDLIFHCRNTNTRIKNSTVFIEMPK